MTLVAARSIGNIPALTSLRFFAALAVFVNHAPDAIVPKSHWAIGAALGMSGVDFFFVLSGLILSHAYRDRLEQPGAVRQYYAGRAARIWPLHLAGLVLFAALEWMPPTPFDFLTLLLNILLLQAYVPFQDVYFSWNLVSWSLSAEIFFYLMFPLLLPRIARLASRPAAIVLTLVIAAVFAWSIITEPYPWNHWAVYINPLARLADFATGMLLYHLIAGRAIAGRSAIAAEAAVLILVVLLGAFFTSIPPSLRQSAIFLPMALVMIGVFFVSRGPLARLLAWRPLVYLGEISFAFYVVHKIIIDTQNNPSLFGTFAAFVMTLLAAMLLHHAVEIPANAWLRRKLAAREIRPVRV